MKVQTLTAALLIVALTAPTFAAIPGTPGTSAGLGDFNQDGQLDEADRDLFGLYLFGFVEAPQPAEWNMDLNFDGKITVSDLSVIGYLVTGYSHSIPAQEQTFVYGDVDEDGQVTYSDVAMLANHIGHGSPLDAPMASADLDGDNQITTADLQALMSAAQP